MKRDIFGTGGLYILGKRLCRSLKVIDGQKVNAVITGRLKMLIHGLAITVYILFAC